MQPIPTSKSELAEYFMIRSTTELPIKVNYYFNSLEGVLEHGPPAGNLPNVNRAFLLGFSKLSLSEKAHYLNENIKFVAKALLKKIDQAIPSQEGDIKLIETSAELAVTMFKIPRWITVNFKLNKNKNQVTLTTKKKSEQIYLQNYIIRRSKKYKGTIVFVGVSEDIKPDKKKIELYFKESIANEIYEELFQSVMWFRNREILAMIEQDSEKEGDKGSMVFLSAKNINEFINFKDQVMKTLLSGKLDFQTVVERDSPARIKVQKCLNLQKLFKSEGIYPCSPKELKLKFMNALRNNKVCISQQVLETFSIKYTAVYQKFAFEGKILDLITLREETMSEQEEVLFAKGIKNIMTENFMEFALAKVKDMGQGKCKLLIVCSFNIGEVIRPELVRDYLLMIHEAIHEEGMTESQPMSEEQFYTVYGREFGNEEFVEFIEAEEELKQTTIIDIPKEIVSIKQDYLHHRYRLLPDPAVDPKKCLMADHYLFKEWVRRKEGGVICTNETIINEQKKMFKHVITTFGNNILKGGSILNISLPVNIFKKESHLESIGRDFCYAPLFFDGLTDRLERVKFATLLAISVGTLGISMDKPFNPILGETLQLWIGGCPIYLEQISHHPPIGSYYMQGRGYKIYGCISPKISFGMNNVKGYSQMPNYIVFDDGTEIEVSYGKMIIHGLLFGDREFNFNDKIFAYDKTNSIFSQITYGPKKKSMMSRNSDPSDFCYGRIYNVRPEFRKKFESVVPRPYPAKQHILDELSQYQGVWNQVIRFDGKEYINFKTDLPCKLQYEEFSLPSNSLYRKDLLFLQEGKIEQSQTEKQIGEQIQRRDRKLREEYQKNHKI